jgi:hypothetical protein
MKRLPAFLAGVRFAPALLAGALAFPVTLVSADDLPFVAPRIKGRPAKLLHQAMYAKDGRLGFLHDVNNDGSDDFVHLVQEGSTLSFRIMSLLDAKPRIDVELGKGYPAGLGMVNLDADDDMEFIAAYGSRRDRLTKKALGMAASVVTSAMFSAYTAPNTGYVTTFSYAGAPEGLDLQHLIALDGDGSTLWHRDLRENGASGSQWDNVRFRMLVPLDEPGPAVIILTNNVGDGVLGLSGADGTTLWTTALQGEAPPDKWSSAGLLDDGKILPVLFKDNFLTILDPGDGRVVQADHFNMPISALPSWNTFGDGEGEGFLVYGDTGSELQMVSLSTGEVLWSREMEKVRSVLPLDDHTFILVWRQGIQKLSADGTVLLDAAAPEKMKTVFDPVFKDINGDGSLELVFVSGKKIVCWDPQQDRVLWTESLASFVGGANPVALYDAFYDVNGDGWLDVPAATGGSAGRWLSGETGEVIVKVGAAWETPLVGDWDGNGHLDLFWWNNWYEIRPAKTK